MKLSTRVKIPLGYAIMKSNEFIRKTHHKGTYAAGHFSNETKEAVQEYIKENSIPNPTPTDKLHATILYSRRNCPNYVAQGDIEPPYIGTPGEFQIWKGQPDDKGHEPNCLIMEFDCPELTARHEELMDEHNALYDFDEYKTHITFSYDVADMDINDLPDYTGPVEVVHEYGEVLDIDWAQNNAKEE